MYKFIIIYFIVASLSGCAGNPTAVRGAELANKDLLKERSPYRVDVKVFEGGGAVTSTVWAGTKGTSIMEAADNTLKSDVWKFFEKQCGLHKSALREVRVVQHKHPFYYEVWVFNDKESKRDDETTGISLILNFSPSGGTDINLVGSCHP